MTMLAYANQLPSWFLPYGYKPSAWYDEQTQTHYTLDLGSIGGDPTTFCSYLFKTVRGDKAQQIAIPIPVVHACLETAGGSLWIYGMSEKAKFWQGPVPGVVAPRLAARAAAAPVEPVLSKKAHDRLPVLWPGLFDALWEGRLIRAPLTGGVT